MVHGPSSLWACPRAARCTAGSGRSPDPPNVASDAILLIYISDTKEWRSSRGVQCSAILAALQAALNSRRTLAVSSGARSSQVQVPAGIRERISRRYMAVVPAAIASKHSSTAGRPYRSNSSVPLARQPAGGAAVPVRGQSRYAAPNGHSSDGDLRVPGAKAVLSPA